MPRRSRGQHLYQTQAKTLARLVRPRCVGVFREQLARIKRSRLGDRLRVRGGARGLFESQSIDDDVMAGPQLDHVTCRFDRVFSAQRAAREVNRLAQVGRGRVGIEVGPHPVHHSLAVQPVAIGEREDLYQLGGAAMLPCAGRNAVTVDAHSKLSHQVNLASRHRSPRDFTVALPIPS
ncbi:MAG: hypothetical protein HY700_06605 [Gemmatimonadetes bacterium]|nr:hypothetical protein [Gemmatimonadota bacterium]